MDRAYFFIHMRKLLLFCILASLPVLSAKSSMAVTLDPSVKTYSISVAQNDSKKVWDGQLTLVFPDELTIAFPSRLKVGLGPGVLSLGYGGFWQDFSLLPHFSREQALLYQGDSGTRVALFRGGGQQAIGAEHALAGTKVSFLAWTQAKPVLHSYQREWGAVHAAWGVAAKVLLKPAPFVLGAEALFTPVTGVKAFVSSSFKYGGCSLGFAYGQEPYPTRYSFGLDLKSRLFRATFELEDWLGSEPIYGGYSTIRKRRQSGSVQVSLAAGYLFFSVTDTYEFKLRGSESGRVVLQAKWVGRFGQVSAHYKQKRGGTNVVNGKGEYKLTLLLNKVTLSYSSEGYEMAIADSVVIGGGIGTWKLKKGMGKAVSLVLSYAVTSGL